MRLAVTGDADSVEQMVLRRSVWLEARGMRSWRESAEYLAASASEAAGNLWVVEADACIVGCVAVEEAGGDDPPWGWTAAELAEPAHYLYSLVTDPTRSGLGLGGIILLWAVGRAARQGRGWVRLTCEHPNLVRYYRAKGFHPVRSLSGVDGEFCLLARRAEEIPGSSSSRSFTLSR
ncbi:GNAT family N-acetyltransferase [Streptomyces mirabilis]